MRYPNFVTNVPADGIAHDRARPSAVTALTHSEAWADMIAYGRYLKTYFIDVLEV